MGYHVLAFLIGTVVGLGPGAYLHYRYGSSVLKAVQQIETRVQDAAKKL
jgi:hypothetical protein